MRGLSERACAGCLFIDGGRMDRRGCGGGSARIDIPGVEVRAFRCTNARGLRDRLQSALQEVRARWGTCAVMATGEGCAAALALACQLPVDKLVLIDPAAPTRPPRLKRPGNDSPEAARLGRAMRRLAAFARRNLPLCVSDVLIVCHGGKNGEDAMRRAYGNPVNCQVERLYIRGECEKELYTIREFAVKEAISRFLNPFEGSKPLAENPEMCIIYG